MKYIIQRDLRTAILCVLVITVSACSTVTSYKKPITDFSTATSNAEAALLKLDLMVSKDNETILRREVLDVPLRVDYDGCELGSEHCRITVRRRGGKPMPFPPEPMLGKIIDLMRGITLYTQDLNAIVTADTSAKVAASVNAAMGSIEALSTTINKQSGATLTVYKDPISKAVNWMFGQRIAKLQIDGLRRATSRADPVIARAAMVFESSADQAEVFAHDELVAQFDLALKKNKDSPSDANLTALVARASAYDVVLKSRPSLVFAKLAPVHNALTRSLQGEGESVVDLIARIDAFAAQAQTVVEIVRELDAAGKKQGGS